MKSIQLLSFGFFFAVSVSAKQAPNIVLINADDLGYGDVSCYGASKIQTPNIDRLAADGRRFTDAHSSSAVCSPSRFGLMTGIYPSRVNLWGPLGSDQHLVIPTDQATIGSLLQEAGYRTAIIGKWHLGLTQGVADYNKPLVPGPKEVGFGYSFIVPTVNSGPPFVFAENGLVVGLDPNDPIKRGGKPNYAKKLPEKGGDKRFSGGKKAHELYDDFRIGTKLAEQSLKWINMQDDKPFFLCLMTTNIHHPFTPAERFQGTSQCGAYGDFVHELDWIVGEVVKAAEARGKANGRETLVIFTSDNGGMLNMTGQKAWTAGHRLNGDLLGYKFGAWEGGHRVPFIVKWPGKVPAGSETNNLVSQIDLLATFAEIIGQTAPTGVDSISQLDEFLGRNEKPLRKDLIVLSNSSNHISVRTKKWLYLPAPGPGGFSAKWGHHLTGGVAALAHTKQANSNVEKGQWKADAPRVQLYDLENDLGQSTNLARKHPELVKQLQQTVDRHRKQIADVPRLGWVAPGNKAAPQRKKKSRVKK
ncbi:arylsulfatase [Verrucomicrobiaceae bacterium N1E253]|uniref:Arylsulfatase n=2 Tax=Oceaniferula marina TaxID=2748318 RepID=A0A851GEM6_9BACT|nr:arylsulfatase [Oceaniferula marina]